MTNPIISIQNLTKSYRQGISVEKVKAVDDLSLEISEGSVVGLIGPNGAGKTTTIYCMLGMLLPDEGTITICDSTPSDPSVRARIGYQSEIFNTYEFLTPRRALRLYGRLSGMSNLDLDDAIDPQLERLGLGKAMNRKISGFSKGMRQRLGVAQALLHDPDILILDEPFTGLDPQGRKQISDIVMEEKQKGKTVFFSSHILSDIERLCDEVVMIQEGKVSMSGNIGDLTASEDLWRIDVEGWQEAHFSLFETEAADISGEGNRREIICTGHHKKAVLGKLLELPVDIRSVNPKILSLEERYMELEKGKEEA